MDDDFNEIVGTEVELRKSLCKPPDQCLEKSIKQIVRDILWINGNKVLNITLFPYQTYIDGNKLTVLCPVCHKRFEFDN